MPARMWHLSVTERTPESKQKEELGKRESYGQHLSGNAHWLLYTKNVCKISGYNFGGDRANIKTAGDNV